MAQTKLAILDISTISSSAALSTSLLRGESQYMSGKAYIFGSTSSAVMHTLMPDTHEVGSHVAVIHCRSTAGSPLGQRCRNALRLCSSHTTLAMKGTTPQKAIIRARLPSLCRRWGCLASSYQEKSSTSRNAKRLRAWK